MNLKHLSNDQLHLQTKTCAEKERLTTIAVLWHLRENEKRMLYAKMGYRDLKEYCVKELKYSEGSAWRRISAMKLLMDVPEVETKIQSGDLNLTQIAMARTHFREVRATKIEKQEILLALENQSTRASEKILAEQKPEGFVAKPEIIEKPLRGHRLEVTLILDEELQKQLEEIGFLLGRQYSKLELFKLLAKEKLERLYKEKTRAQLLDEKRKAQPASSKTQTSINSRYISKITLREVKDRDQNRCQYKDPKTGRQCEANLHLQTEHIIPFAKGGQNDTQNLQLLCSSHNRQRAVEQFGVGKMKNYLPSLK